MKRQNSPATDAEGAKGISQADKFHAPLHPQDSAVITHGCRHTNPEICGKHSMSGVCAFVRGDGLCQAPPRTWPRQYELLKNRSSEAK